MDWQLTQSLATSITFSDNVNLDPDSTKEEAVSPRITYGVNGTGKGGRSIFTTNSTVSARADSKQDNASIDPSIRALGRAELVEDRLFLDATFSSIQELINIGSASSANPNANQNSQSSVTSFSLSPTYQQRIGRYGDAQVTYRHTEIFTTDDIDEGRGDAIQFQASAGQGINYVKPALTVAWYNFDERAKQGRAEDDIRQFSAQLANTIPVSRNHAFLVTLGYDDVDTSSSNRNLSGVFWSVGMTGRAGKRIQYTFQVGQRYDSVGIVGNASYDISPNLRLQVSASQDVGTALQRAGTQVQRLTVDTVSGSLLGPNGLPPGFLRSDLNDGISTNQNFDLGLVGSYGKNTITLGASTSRREYDNGTEYTRTTRVSWIRAFSSRVSASFGGFYRNVDEIARAETHTVGGSAGLNYQIGRRTSLFVNLSHTERFSDNANSEFTENAATVGGRITF